MRKKRKSWKACPMSEEQAAWLRIHAATTSRDEMAAHCGWSLRLLARRLQQLGLTWIKGPRKWTADDNETLRKLAGTMTIRAIAKKMNRDFTTIYENAAELDLNLTFNRWWPEGYDARLRDLAAKGYTRREVAREMHVTYRLVLVKLRALGIEAARERPTPTNDQRRRCCAKKLVRSERAPRERVGIPKIRRIHVAAGAIAWCSRCHAPVVDTPQAWADHNRRVHVEPVRLISKIEAARPCGRAAAVWRIA